MPVNARSILARQNALWNLGIIGTAVIVLGANLAGLLMGITIVLPHLLYIPVVIAAYRYPKQGLLFSGIIAGVYFLMVIVVQGISSMAVVEALVRAIVVTAIGGLIAFITLRLRAQETLYHGLFDHSEGGSILARNVEGTWTVEEVNWNAATLLKHDPAGLKGMPLTLFWDETDARDVLTLFSGDGKVYARETTFHTAEGELQQVLLSMAPIPGNRAILTFVDITRRVAAEQALQMANDKLHLLSRISVDHLHRTVNDMIETIDAVGLESRSEVPAGIVSRVRNLARNLARQLFLTETYQNLGASLPYWIPVQETLASGTYGEKAGGISVRFWTGRLELYADPLIRDVLNHLVENGIQHGRTLKNMVVWYQKAPEGINLVIDDDGIGIPEGMKEKIFEYDSGGYSGLGLFICRQILGITGMTIVENGKEGKGARFVIHVPEGNYRIEGTGEDAPPFTAPDPSKAAALGARHASGTLVRELTSAEFQVADALWVDYHQTTGDPLVDRIFAAFADGEPVSLARCRQHPDGLEVDGIFTPEQYRGHGYANAAVWGLVDACGHDLLYMHSVLNLTGFYARYGFVPIPEVELPLTIRERFAWAAGEMEGANVQPMKRDPTE
jgi:signal transduction histidine kinase/GNAT superfamily N-acetyltransferase